MFMYSIRATNVDQLVPITFSSELALTRQRYPAPTEYITFFDLSPDGERIAVAARGEIFCIPVKDGPALPITRGSGARESWPTFDAKGERIFFVSDATREEAIHSIDAWGRGEAKVVKPAGKVGWHFPAVPSPNGKWIAYADQTQTLYVDAGGRAGKPRAVDHSVQAEIRSYEWSPDGRYLAYRIWPLTEFTQVKIYDTKTSETHAVSGPYTIDHSPAWDPEGRYLYFLSDRTLNPVFDIRDFQNIEVNSTKPYLVLLKKDGENPFAKTEGMPPQDGKKKDDKKKDDKKDKKKGDDGDDEEDEKIEPIEIDFEGLSDRVVEVPVDPASTGDSAPPRRTCSGFRIRCVGSPRKTKARRKRRGRHAHDVRPRRRGREDLRQGRDFLGSCPRERQARVREEARRDLRDGCGLTARGRSQGREGLRRAAW